MESKEQGQRMEKLFEWFRENGGQLHPSIKLEHNVEYGYHFVSASGMVEEELACKCPFSLTLSPLNVLGGPSGGKPVEDSVCKYLFSAKLGLNVIGGFFLAEQYLKGEDSFWSPYISLLPSHEQMTTPLFFDETDLLWLKGTNIYTLGSPDAETALGMRRQMYREGWENGINALEAAGVDSSPYTWYKFISHTFKHWS
jgi:hypothetical protein